MGTYVIGDIHGCYSLWMKLKDKIEAIDSDARFILVGDIVDRGPSTLSMIQWAMKNITPDGKYRMVLGNHEQLKIGWWTAYKKFKTMAIEKGEECSISDFTPEPYGFNELIEREELTDDYVDSIIEFFKILPVIIEESVEIEGNTVKYIIAHADVNEEFLLSDGTFDKELLTNNDYISTKFRHVKTDFIRDSIIWDRNYFGKNWDTNTILIHGHTPTNSRDLIVRGAISGSIDFKNKDINVDCGAVFEGQLGAIRLNDLEEFYEDSLDTDDIYYEDKVSLRKQYGNNYTRDLYKDRLWKTIRNNE